MQGIWTSKQIVNKEVTVSLVLSMDHWLLFRTCIITHFAVCFYSDLLELYFHIHSLARVCSWNVSSLKYRDISVAVFEWVKKVLTKCIQRGDDMVYCRKAKDRSQYTNEDMTSLTSLSLHLYTWLQLWFGCFDELIALFKQGLTQFHKKSLFHRWWYVKQIFHIS